MRKITACILALLLTAACAGCGADSGGTGAKDAQTPQYNTISEADPVELEKLEGEVKLAAGLCRDVLLRAGGTGDVNAVLTSRDIGEMVRLIGEAGYTVAGGGDADVQNPQLLVEFGEKINAAQAAKVKYFTVCPDGSVGEYVLSCENGGGYLTALQAGTDGAGGEELYSEGRYALEEVRYTEKGYLIYKRDISGLVMEKKWNVNPYTLVRAVPEDEECKELCSKYIEPVGYLKNDLFTVSWGGGYGLPDFSFLYQYLYSMDSGTQPGAELPYPLIEGTNIRLVPSEEFERITEKFFELDAERLKSAAVFDTAMGAYPVVGLSDCDFSTVPKTPEPEVTGFWYNPDGSLTMEVDAVFEWAGTDRAFTHEVTVMDSGDGSFKYISNYVHESEENIFPDSQFGVTDEIRGHYAPD